MIRMQPNKLVRLGGKAYDIRYNEEDKKRREKGKYTAQELQLLHDIGLSDIDTQLSENDKQQLPEFFEALPNCQTSAAIALSAKCYQPHYILDSIRRHAELEKQEQFEKMKQMPSPTLDMEYRTNAMLEGVAKLIVGSVKPLTGLAETVTDSEIVNLFILRIPA